MKKRMLWVCIYTWDEEENALGVYLYLGWRRECSGYVWSDPDRWSLGISFNQVAIGLGL
jgi:hypothetical protein